MSDTLPIFSFRQTIENGGFELESPLPQKETFYVRATTIVSDALVIAGELVVQAELTLFAELTLRLPCLRQTTERTEGIYGFQVNATGPLPTGIVQEGNLFTGVRAYDAYTASLQKTFVTSAATVTSAHTGYGGFLEPCLVFSELVLQAELRLSSELTIRSVEGLYEETQLVPFMSDYAAQLPDGVTFPLDLTSAGVYRDLTLTGEKTFTLLLNLKGVGSHTLLLTDLAGETILASQTVTGLTTWTRTAFSYRPSVTTTLRFWLLPDRACQQLYTDAWGILAEFPLTVTRATGFHAPERDLLITPYAGLDGSYLHGVRTKPRKLALEGFILAANDDDLVLLRDEIWSAINPRTQGSFVQEPFTLTYCPSEDFADAVNIDVVYESGLESTPGAINPFFTLGFIATNPYFYKVDLQSAELSSGAVVSTTGTQYRIRGGEWQQFRPYGEDSTLIEIHADYAYYTTATAMYKQALSQLPNGTRTVILNQANLVIRQQMVAYNGLFLVYGTGWYKYDGFNWSQLNQSNYPVGLVCALAEKAIVYTSTSDNTRVLIYVYTSSTVYLRLVCILSNITKLALTRMGYNDDHDDYTVVVIHGNKQTSVFYARYSIAGVHGDYKVTIMGALPYCINFCVNAPSWISMLGDLRYYIANELKVYMVGYNTSGVLVGIRDVTYDLTQYSETIDLRWDNEEERLYVIKEDAVYFLDERLEPSWHLHLSAPTLNRFTLGTHGVDLSYYEAAILDADEFLTSSLNLSTTVINPGSAETNAILTFIGKCYISEISLVNDKNPKILCKLLISDVNETVIIDTAAGTIISNTRGSLASLLLPGSNLAGFKLQPGTNTVRVMGVKNDANSKFYCSWRNRYLSGRA